MRRPMRAIVAATLVVVAGGCDDDDGSTAPTTDASASIAVSHTSPATILAATTSVPPATTVAPPTTPVTTVPATTVPDECPPTAVDAAVAPDATLTLGPAPGVDPTTAVGEPLIISGTVNDEQCMGVEGVLLHFWQTDAEGMYGPGHDTGQLECCYLQGDVTTDANGRYRIVTVMPGHYFGESSPPPRHIHVEGRHVSGDVMAEIVFDDDPYLTNPDADGYVIAVLEPAIEGQPREGTADLALV